MTPIVVRIILAFLAIRVNIGLSKSSPRSHAGKRKLRETNATQHLRGSLDFQDIQLQYSELTNIWTESLTAPAAAWSASASSSSGEYLYGVVSGGLIYSSVTYGATWNSYDLLGDSTWTSIACSADGTYVLVCSSEAGVYLSTEDALAFSATNCPTAEWQDVAISSTGDVMAAVAYSEYIYISLDYGDIWTPTVGTSGYNWKSIAMSSTGIYMTAVVYEGSLYQSSDYGSAFTVYSGLDGTFYFMSVEMSSTGSYAVAVTCPGSIYYTADTGASWGTADVAAESDQCWSSVSMSSSGQYCLATEDAGYIYMSSEYGEVWVPSNDAPSDTYWTSVAASSTGQYAVATILDGGVYLGTIAIPSDTATPTASPTVSTNSAYTFTDVIGEDLPWSAVASDQTGLYLVACAMYDGIYLSTDGGDAWTASSVTVTTDYYWVGAASSSDGSIIAACSLDDGYVIVSADFGSSWNQNSGEGEWISVSMSATGQLIAAAEYYGGIYLSTDYGVTWSISSAPEPLYWTSVSMSSESTYLLGTCVDGYVYISSDSGTDWSEETDTPYGTKWKASAVSETGQFMLAAGADIGIYYSEDFGETWAISNAPVLSEWSYLASSASGELAVGVSYSGFVYVSSTYGVTWEICTSAGSAYWLSVAMDASGSQLLLAAEESGVYIGINAAVPSAAPIASAPTVAPTQTAEPTDAPAAVPSIVPSLTPSAAPTNTGGPSSMPTTATPTATAAPSSRPTSSPSSTPTEYPVAGPTKRPTTPAPTHAPIEYPTSWPTAAPIIPTLFPTAVPSITKSPSRQPSIQNSPIVTFNVNVTLTKLTSDVLNENCQNAIIATTAYWMAIESSAIVYVGSYPVPVVRRLGSNSDSAVSGSSSGGGNYSLIVETQTSTSVAATSYTNSSNLYNECVKKLDTAVANGDYTETLQIESQTQYYDAVATQYAVATLIAESVPLVIQEPSHPPTLAPTMSTAPGKFESFATIVPGVILFILVIMILHMREPIAAALNELNSYVGEVMDAAVKCFIVILSVNLIAEYASDTNSPSFLLLIFSKLALFALWCFFILAFFFPVRTVNGERRVQLALLLHKEPFKVKLSFSVYGLLMTMSIFDLTFLRLMPWIRTNLTDSMQGYPNTFMIRCCLYGTFISHLIQSLAIIIRIVFESKSEGNGPHAQEDKEKAVILLAFSVFNVFRAFISMLFVVRIAKSDKLKLAVVNESDVAVLADFMRKTEFQEPRDTSMDDSSTGTGSKNKKGFTPGRISTMLFNVAGFRSSTLASPSSANDGEKNTTENPLNKNQTKDGRESFLNDENDTNRIVSEDFASTGGADGDVPRYVKKNSMSGESIFSDMTGESGEVDDRGIRFSASTKFADQTLEILRSQLKKEGKIPVEFIPLTELKAEIAVIFSKANNGVPYDEARLDYLLMCMDFNPEYKAEKELETKRWRNEIGPFASDCQEMMRGFVPPFVFHASQESLVNEYGMSKELAKRIIMKKCLWLVRVSVADIDRMHIAELQGRFNPEAQGLDIVEIAAIFQSIPEKFGNDPDGKKERWRASLEQNLKNLVTEKASGTLMKSKLRNPAYTNQIPPFAHRESMHEMSVTSGEDAFKPRSSFRMLGGRSSLIAASSGGGGGAISGGTVQQHQQHQQALDSARNSEVADELSPLPRASITNLNDRNSTIYGGSGLPPPARPSMTGRPTRTGSLRGSMIGEALNKIFASNMSSNGSVRSTASNGGGGNGGDGRADSTSDNNTVNDQL